jgi:hypothetical protein
VAPTLERSHVRAAAPAVGAAVAGTALKPASDKVATTQQAYLHDRWDGGARTWTPPVAPAGAQSPGIALRPLQATDVSSLPVILNGKRGPVMAHPKTVIARPPRVTAKVNHAAGCPGGTALSTSGTSRVSARPARAAPPRGLRSRIWRDSHIDRPRRPPAHQ